MDDQLIGRERERARLRAYLADSLAGRGSLVLLAGEAGVGKTTLALRALAGSGLDVLEGFGVQRAPVAFGPIVEVLRSWLRSRGGPLVEGPLAAHLAPLLPELGPPAPEGDRATLLEAIRLALTTIPARHPTALLLDDLHWADDATLELLPALARWAEEQPLLVLGAFRSDELPRGHPVRRMRSELRRAGHLREIAVEPLEAEAAGALPRCARPYRRRPLLRRGAGVGAGGQRAAAAGTVRPGAAGGRGPAISGQRPRRRPAPGGGQSFDPELVAAVAGLPEWPDELLRRGIVTEAEPGRMAFRHALIRDAFYGEVRWTPPAGATRPSSTSSPPTAAPASSAPDPWCGAWPTTSPPSASRPSAAWEGERPRSGPTAV